MARYSNIDELINWCNETYKAQTTVVGKGYVNAFLRAVVMSETEDVVPRSELELNEKAYESLKQLYDNDTKELSDNIERLISELEQAKQEAAREIFAEIERFLYDDKTLINITKFAELKKKYIGE